MDLLRRISQALDYIEENLTYEIDYETVAQKACCSSYNFQRIFSFITDVTLAEYIRRRRLTQAALELQNSEINVVDVAVKYGYESSAAFSRAFTHLHGVKPSLARNEGVALQAYPKITFQISMKGEKSMEYRIESKPAFDIYGIETVCSTIGDENYASTAQHWQQCVKNGSCQRLEDSAGAFPDFMDASMLRADRYCTVNGVSYPRGTRNNTFQFMLFCFKGTENPPPEFTTVHIPAATYAVFSVGPVRWEDNYDTIGKLRKRIFAEWFPTSEYELADAADFEFFGSSGELAMLELWYPLKKSQ